jgi:hypothetical protein
MGKLGILHDFTPPGQLAPAHCKFNRNEHCSLGAQHSENGNRVRLAFLAPDSETVLRTLFSDEEAQALVLRKDREDPGFLLAKFREALCLACRKTCEASGVQDIQVGK